MERTMTLTPFSVPVRGGSLAGGQWRADAAGLPLLAVHGITATHRSWRPVAEALDARVVAPDLRGRGRSNGLPGPYTLRDHADDLAYLLDGLGVDRALVVGHSMGAFVTVRFAAAHPDRVAGVVLIDGGLPIPHPEGLAADQVAQATLGPALERLAMTFPDADAYAGFWRRHPALGPAWNDAIADYVAYDLDGEPPALRPSANPDAVAVNVLELDGSDGYLEELLGLPGPVDFLRAQRGLLDQPEALYPPEHVDEWERRMPTLRRHEVPDVNHYTIIMTEEGAGHVVSVLATRLAEGRVAASVTAADKEVAP
ncbi:alpha/beta hydrolase [Agromyces tardus]|uniref:Alpha/beta hydrolase n=2 Tax=Agromyces tardus TaxID=2583849 RepID=A0A3M8A6T9_9MICO|nr:alpha/beta hydrolase [Agromyces tardus]